MLRKRVELQAILIGAGLLAAAILLIRFAIDLGVDLTAYLGGRLSFLITAPFVLLVVSSLAVGSINLVGEGKDRTMGGRPGWPEAALLAAVPLGFLASSLDCTGLTFAGCTATCTFIKAIWIPVMAAACAAFFLWPRRWMLTVIAMMSFVPLIPNCICSNPGNSFWIGLIGASPVCYVWGFTVSLISIGALRKDRSGRALGSLAASVGVSYLIIGGALSFFVGHHYFHFPW